jgi:hypothetical protein
MVGGCAAAPELPKPDTRPRTEATSALAVRRLPSVSWQAVGPCRTLAAAVAAMPEGERSRLPLVGAPIAFSVRDGAATLPPAEAMAAVTADLPLPVDDGSARCVILVEATRTVGGASRRPLAHQVVPSTYRASTGGGPNPEYRHLKRELRELDDDDRVGLVATGDPALDLVGLIAGSVLEGLDAAFDGRRAAAIKERLGATPPTLAEPVWEPYSFEVTTIEATREGLLRVRLVDRATLEAWLFQEPVVERRRFRVATGRRARDRSLLEGGGGDLAATTDIAVWEQAGLRPSLSGLVAALGAIAIPAVRVTESRSPPAARAAVVGTSRTIEELLGDDGVRRYRLRDEEAALSRAP